MPTEPLRDPLSPSAPPTLLDLLTAPPGACTVAVLPLAAEQPAPGQARRSGAAPLLRRLAAPLMLAARVAMRRPRVRQLALRILKRSPGLYARAYRMMMASGGAAAPPGPAQQGDDIGTLSPRANAILRTLRRLHTGAPRPAGDRPRLAFVSPLPPERTGVAAYAAELLAELAHHFEIELVVAQDSVALPAPLAHLPVRQAAWFFEHGGEYDQVLYQVGNSPFHSHMFALLARHPGVVVLHDFFLGGALLHARISGIQPRAWTEALFDSHGYAAVRASDSAAGRGQAHKDWPASLPVLEHATRTIVHSRHARGLAAAWFGPGAAQRIDVIPHPRTPPVARDRAAARAALGIPEDCFLVCSFGFVTPHKLTHELLRAWAASPLHTDPRCALVLVGANHDSPYGVEVEALIRAAGPGAGIRIAGWTDDAVYRQYLQAADVGVQLRTNAHGESSGAVLDCLNYGLPTIVNANGSMAEFPPDAVWQLPDAFAVSELSAALASLRGDPARRKALGERAVALLDAGFRPARCAGLYLETLARARAATAAQHAAWQEAAAALAGLDAGADEAALQALATRLSEQESATRRRVLVDVSDAVRPSAPFDPLAASQLRALLGQAGNSLVVEPVYLDQVAPIPCYRQARNAAGRLLGLRWPEQDEPVVDFRAGDIYYGLDAAGPAVEAAFDTGLLAAWRARGVGVSLLVRDLPDGAAPRAAAAADRLLCANEAIAQQLTAQSRAH